MTATGAHPIPPQETEPALCRVRLELEGLVQGVGFRPYVNRLALSLGLTGWVANSGDGVTVEVEGAGHAIEAFRRRLPSDLPRLARLDRSRETELDQVGYTSFTIRRSICANEPTALILPDIATCDDCLREIFEPTDRRYRYPFTNCTNCGPRFSILEALPYDRPNTTMSRFTMCAACRSEYEAAADRRFHAQPNACPECGPRLTLLDPAGVKLAHHHAALAAAADGLRDGQVVALKGLGGFQLLADARDAAAVTELRRRKGRPDKPFATMVPSLAFAEAHCEISDIERGLLASPEAPIVLLSRRPHPRAGERELAAQVAPCNPLLGVMLPYTPLHHLLLRELGFPVVATSGNISDEPMVTEENEALERLKGIADLFLTHDRPIASAIDDSVVRIMVGRKLTLRRARGYAPLPVVLPRPAPPLLALGGHLKSAAAATSGSRVLVGPHIGDLDTAAARQAYHKAAGHLRGLHTVRPTAVACDRHPDYYTSDVARRSTVKVIPVQHHLAHVVACMAENGVEGPVLGVAWDGTGYGGDGTVWGGEFIVVDGASTRRVAHFRAFPLPGGETSVSEPRRTAVGLLYEMFGRAALANEQLEPIHSFSAGERRVLGQMLDRNLNAPRTTSVGRLFDAVASLTGLTQQTSFEGQAAMALEFALGGAPSRTGYRIPLQTPRDYDSGPIVLDWGPMIRDLLEDIEKNVPIAEMAIAFHNALIEAIVTVAQRADQKQVVLTGGCFQNRFLTEGAVDRLRRAGFEPCWHQDVPPNDGGLALGQAVWAVRLLDAEVA